MCVQIFSLRLIIDGVKQLVGVVMVIVFNMSNKEGRVYEVVRMVMVMVVVIVLVVSVLLVRNLEGSCGSTWLYINVGFLVITVAAVIIQRW